MKDNPGVHMLYTKWAVRHLLLIRRFMNEISGNVSLNDLLHAVATERDKLIRENKAYYDAEEILRYVDTVDMSYKPRSVNMDDYRQRPEPITGEGTDKPEGVMVRAPGVPANFPDEHGDTFVRIISNE